MQAVALVEKQSTEAALELCQVALGHHPHDRPLLARRKALLAVQGGPGARQPSSPFYLDKSG